MGGEKVFLEHVIHKTHSTYRGSETATVGSNFIKHDDDNKCWKSGNFLLLWNLLRRYRNSKKKNLNEAKTALRVSDTSNYALTLS